jgi:hypothetical protein
MESIPNELPEFQIRFDQWLERADATVNRRLPNFGKPCRSWSANFHARSFVMPRMSLPYSASDALEINSRRNISLLG